MKTLTHGRIGIEAETNTGSQMGATLDAPTARVELDLAMVASLAGREAAQRLGDRASSIASLQGSHVFNN